MVHQEGKSSRTGSRGLGGVLLTGLLNLLLYITQDQRPVDSLPAVGWALSCQSSVQKIPYKLAYWDIFSTELPSFHVTLMCIKLTKTKTKTINQVNEDANHHPTKPDSRSSVAGIHAVEGETWFPQDIFCPPHMCHDTCVSHTCTHKK